MSLADHADNRRRTTKTTIISPPSQTVFLCVIMQLAAFSQRDLRQVRKNIHISILNQCTQKPQCLPQISLIIADEPQKPQ